MEKQEIADVIKCKVQELNELIKEANAAGLDVSIFQLKSAELFNKENVLNLTVSEKIIYAESTL